MPVGQATEPLQTGEPSEHTWPAVPPSDPAGAHSGGSVVLPTHSSHVSHGFVHPAFCVHGLHLVGSSMLAMLHVPDKTTDLMPPAVGTAQQPKQSQPLGVTLRHVSMHVCDCVAGQFL